jgi:hypothetical protein
MGVVHAFSQVVVCGAVLFDSVNGVEESILEAAKQTIDE